MLTEEKRERTPGMIELPAPTVWPMITALGITLLCAGLVTHVAVSAVGLFLALRGAVGWFREVLPVEKHELARVRPTAEQAQSAELARPDGAVPERQSERESQQRAAQPVVTCRLSCQRLRRHQLLLHTSRCPPTAL